MTNYDQLNRPHRPWILPVLIVGLLLIAGYLEVDRRLDEKRAIETEMYRQALISSYNAKQMWARSATQDTVYAAWSDTTHYVISMPDTAGYYNRSPK